jgi:hypothetical protein
VVELQAQEAYAPSYESMVPWRAWRESHPAGLLAVHYGFIYEPYIIAKTPFPSTSLDKWEPFDEFFREPGYDKCIFFTETAGLRVDDPAKYYLHVLPQVFLLNDDAGSSGGPRASRHINWERCVRFSPRPAHALCDRHLTISLASPPPIRARADSWVRQLSTGRGARTCARACPWRTGQWRRRRASGTTATCASRGGAH